MIFIIIFGFITQVDATDNSTYDSMNRLTGRSISRGSGVGGVTSETYAYDALGRLITAGDNAYVTLTGASYTGVAMNNLSFSYDALSRLKSEIQMPLGGTGYTVNYNYSSVGDLTGITLPDGKIQTITYDLLHRPLVTTYSGQTIATNTYTGFFLTGTTYGNGRSILYSYDTINRIASINHGTGSKNPIYFYNDASDIIGDNIKAYAYDGLMRVVSVDGVTLGVMPERFSYDKSGNRVTSILNVANTTYTPNTLDQYTTITGSIYSGSITYDYNGNIKTQGNKAYTYDYNNRLLQVNIGTGIIAQYTYDILGRRTLKRDYSLSATKPTTTIHIYNGDNIQSEYKTLPVGTGSVTLKKNYINGIGQDALIAYEAEEQVSPISTTKVTNRYYYHLNQLGSVVRLTNSTGATLHNYIYDTYGKPYIYSGATLTPISPYTGTMYSNTRLYTGREYDKETDLYYLRARYYNSDTGRFISRDPIGQNDQVNLYTYVRNSPLMYTDRDGKAAKGAIAWFGNIADSLGPVQAYGDLNPSPVVKKDIGVLGEVVVVGGGFFLPGGKGESIRNAEGIVLNFTEHAVERLKKWNIQSDEILESVGTKGFKYIHEGVEKVGYFSEKTGVFVGTIENRITTTFRTNLNYINNLKNLGK